MAGSSQHQLTSIRPGRLVVLRIITIVSLEDKEGVSLVVSKGLLLVPLAVCLRLARGIGDFESLPLH